MRKLEQLTYILIIGGFALSIVFYPYLPSMIASHWDMSETPDRFISKSIGLFAIPIVSLIFWFLFREVPRLDPNEDNVKHLKPYYDEFLFVLTAFFFYIHFVMIIWNSGIRFHLLQLVAPAFGLLLYYLGNLMSLTRRNYIIGIANPWSMYDEKLWKKTHIFAGTIFKTAGALTCLGFIFYSLALYFILAPLLLAIIYTYIYSYTEYTALRNHPHKK